MVGAGSYGTGSGSFIGAFDEDEANGEVEVDVEVEVEPDRDDEPVPSLLKKAVTSPPVDTMLTTVQPSADFSVSLAAERGGIERRRADGGELRGHGRHCNQVSSGSTAVGGDDQVWSTSACTSVVARLAVVAHLALRERDQALDALHERQLVRRDHDRRAAPRAPRRAASSKRRLAGRVEADERLVDEQQLEGADERERDRGLLAQAAAERAGQVVDALGQADPRDELVGARPTSR